jgi:Zn-dependent protease with chaperone function
MNFFDAQDKARRVTRWLVVVFAVATAIIVGAVTLVVAAAAYFINDGQIQLQPSFLVGIAIATTVFIVGASSYKVARLAGGGGRVAVDMGGTLVTSDVGDPLRRRLRNVVEEMSIASGVPVPQIYVLEAESGINAFAAGFAPGDAAVAVTRGTLESLNRAELQGVIAHEFSHILNGDMRLNIRLMGVLFGIVALSLIGRTVLRSGTRASYMSSRRGLSQPVVVVIGIGLTIVGWAGVLFARMIKAAVSRQREFLADASAVQFTRQTDGIANALKKIGGYSEHSYFRATDAEEVSHMLFANGMSRMSSLFATHPPLIERIRALDPSFSERDYPESVPGSRHEAEPPHQVSGFDAGLGAALAAGNVAGLSRPIGDAIGDPQPQHVDFAQRLRKSVPADLYDAAHSHELSLMLAVALALHPNTSNSARQSALVRDLLGNDRAEIVSRFHREIIEIGPAYRLPLLEISFPTLKLRPKEHLEFLLQLVSRLIELDGRIDLREFCYYRILSSQLGQAMLPGARRKERASKPATRLAAVQLIRIIADQGNESRESADQAYSAGVAAFGEWASKLKAPVNAKMTVDALDRSLDVLSSLDSKGQRRLIEAVNLCISRDGQLSLAEAELLRAVCASLDCPLPPVLAAVLPDNTAAP